jgi:hypothetical protein
LETRERAIQGLMIAVTDGSFDGAQELARWEADELRAWQTAVRCGEALVRGPDQHIGVSHIMLRSDVNLHLNFSALIEDRHHVLRFGSGLERPFRAVALIHLAAPLPASVRADLSTARSAFDSAPAIVFHGQRRCDCVASWLGAALRFAG